MLIELTVYQLTEDSIHFVARGHVPQAPREGDVLAVAPDERLPTYFAVRTVFWPIPNTKSAILPQEDGTLLAVTVGQCEVYCRRFDKFPLGAARTQMLYGDDGGIPEPSDN